MRPKVKYAVIYRHRNEYPVSVMCKFFKVSRSGYYAFLKRLERPESDAALARKIEQCQSKADKTYGYRRVSTKPMGVTLPWCKGYCNIALLKPHRGTLALNPKELRRLSKVMPYFYRPKVL